MVSLSEPTAVRTVAARTVAAWDWPTRLFHWLLVTLFISAWVSFEFAPQLGDATLKWHRWNGMAILVLLVFRLLWGVVGSSTSRIHRIMRSPGATLAYAAATLKGKAPAFLGHNPLGSLMIVVLFLAMATQAVLGLYTLEHNEITAGPLQRTISEDTTKLVSGWHGRGFNLILAIVAVHVLANSLYQIVKKDPLVTAMVTGRKPAAAYADEREAVIVSWLGARALGCLVAAAGIVFGTITLLGGRLL